jgi:hypothetical protein
MDKVPAPSIDIATRNGPCAAAQLWR